MTIRLSHSSVSLYNSCSYKWHMHYQKKLRERVKSAALHFGDCMDKAINQMLADHRDNKLRPVGLYVSQFAGLWEHVMVLTPKGVEIKENAMTTNGIGYADSDFDKDLIKPEDVSAIAELFEMENDLAIILKKYYAVVAIRKEQGFDNLHPSSVAYMNAVNWHVLKNKGSLIIEQYYKDVIKKIVKVLAIQQQVSLDDGHGNSVVGYVDAVLDFGQGPVICDLKTSSMQYESDSASNSEQLALYKHCLKEVYDTENVCFIVAYKHIQKLRDKVCSVCKFVAKEGSSHKTCYNEVTGGKKPKRCGGAWDETLTLSARIEIVPGKIDPTFEDMVVSNFDSVLRGVEAGVFTKNWQNCEAYNRKCAYYNLCRKGSDSKLIKIA